MEKIAEKNETYDFDELTKKIEEEILEEERGIYTEKTLEVAYNPKNVGELEAPSGASMACGSVVTELVKGKTIEEALTVEDKDVLSVLGGLPEENIHCSVLAMDTLRAALEDYKSKNKCKNKSKNKKRNEKERR